MITMDMLWCAPCWSSSTGMLWGILAWFLLVAFALFAVASCRRAARRPVYVDDEENVISLDIMPQSGPWGAEVICGELRASPAHSRRKFHAL